MKCVCGYKGGDFVITQILRITKTSITLDNVKTIYTTDNFEWVYACPKCGTLKVEVSNEH